MFSQPDANGLSGRPQTSPEQRHHHSHSPMPVNDELLPANEPVDFQPTRESGLSRLEHFANRTGRHYANWRNHDLGPDRRSNVSALSPWIRHRSVTEVEALTACLRRYAPSTAEKFIQEVFWRTYFKGWLEQRPTVWTGYHAGLKQGLRELDLDRDLSKRYSDAVNGHTGIDAFDAWARELVETGYLHNHARMWFASIWNFTLKLPWQLGADFFLRHLLDGDPASNTLSWRWVAGLHTKGKTYLARRDNIAKYTDGRFSPEGLATTAPPLQEDEDHPKQALPSSDPVPESDYLLLITEEDCQVHELLPQPPAAVLGLIATDARSALPTAPLPQAFTAGVVRDALKRLGVADPHPLDASGEWVDRLILETERAGVRDIVTGFAPVGPVADQLASAEAALAKHGRRLRRVRPRYDDISWPYATKGFFTMKKMIPSILDGLGLL